jgi:hypothetical protein
MGGTRLLQEHTRLLQEQPYCGCTARPRLPPYFILLPEGMGFVFPHRSPSPSPVKRQASQWLGTESSNDHL